MFEKQVGKWYQVRFEIFEMSDGVCQAERSEAALRTGEGKVITPGILRS
jgi:hypothetical protein